MQTLLWRRRVKITETISIPAQSALWREISTSTNAWNFANSYPKGGFLLTKWTSNSQKVLESTPESERAASGKSLNFASLRIPVERALGVRWNVTSDKFGYKITIKDRPATRRIILSVVSSIYDPLGFVAPFIFLAKTILHDMCRRKLGWDDQIPQDALQRWQNWLEMLPKLEEIVVNRCFKPCSKFWWCRVMSTSPFSRRLSAIKDIGAVSYLRIVNQKGDVHCSFLIGKSRLVPLKAVTIPRMELSAAVVATRLDKMMRQELDLAIDESTFLKDSTCVLRNIENESWWLETFVANRVSKIHDASKPSQCMKYVCTNLNSADDTSRGLTATEIL